MPLCVSSKSRHIQSKKFFLHSHHRFFTIGILGSDGENVFAMGKNGEKWRKKGNFLDGEFLNFGQFFPHFPIMGKNGEKRGKKGNFLDGEFQKFSTRIRHLSTFYDIDPSPRYLPSARAPGR